MDEKLDLVWWELGPYVQREREHNDSDSDSLDGFVYSVFVDSMAKCLNWDVDHHNAQVKFNQRRVADQGQLLDVVSDKAMVGMPVILEVSSLRDAPNKFVRVLSTIGLTWMYHHDPPNENMLLSGLATVWPILCIVIIFTGYAALLIWLAERSVAANNYFNRKFHIGILDSYWYAFVSATTVGYGDKVPQSVIGKLVAMVWILCGICSIAVFTAAITTFFGRLTEESTLVPPPLHNVKVGVLNTSIDFRLVAERGAQPIEYGEIETLLDALDNHKIDSIAIDPNVYCLVHGMVKHSYEFRMGATSPTAVGYLLNLDNDTLLDCVRTAAFYQQNEFNHHLKELYQTVQRDPSAVTEHKSNILGKDGGWLYICYAAVGLLIFYAIVYVTDVVTACHTPSQSEHSLKWKHQLPLTCASDADSKDSAV